MLVGLLVMKMVVVVVAGNAGRLVLMIRISGTIRQ